MATHAPAPRLPIALAAAVLVAAPLSLYVTAESGRTGASVTGWLHPLILGLIAALVVMVVMVADRFPGGGRALRAIAFVTGALLLLSLAMAGPVAAQDAPGVYALLALTLFALTLAVVVIVEGLRGASREHGPEAAVPQPLMGALHMVLALLGSFFAFLSYVFSCADGCIWSDVFATPGDQIAALVLVVAAWVGAGALWAGALSVCATGTAERWIWRTAGYAWAIAVVALAGSVVG